MNVNCDMFSQSIYIDCLGIRHFKQCDGEYKLMAQFALKCLTFCANQTFQCIRKLNVLNGRSIQNKISYNDYRLSLVEGPLYGWPLPGFFMRRTHRIYLLQKYAPFASLGFEPMTSMIITLILETWYRLSQCGLGPHQAFPCALLIGYTYSRSTFLSSLRFQTHELYEYGAWKSLESAKAPLAQSIPYFKNQCTYHGGHRFETQGGKRNVFLK